MAEEGFSHPTPFEFDTALAFLYFKEKGCNIVVLETGMGGEGDATNIITTPLVSVFASISRDHMGFLGNTLSEIARKKAGIIKEGIPVISAWQEEEAMKEIESACKQKHAAIHLADKESLKAIKGTESGILFSYKDYGRIKLSLRGTCQPANAAVALEVLDCLREEYGFVLPKEK